MGKTQEGVRLMIIEENFKALEMREDELVLLDQRLLPCEEKEFICRSVEDVFFAIKDMVVRGAPAIGGAAGYGVYFAAREASGDMDEFNRLCDHLIQARPTAVNLAWAVNRVRKTAEASGLNPDAIRKDAQNIVSEDIAMNRKIGEIGSSVIPPHATILTHCNTGALATCGWGTALGVIKTAFYEGKDIFVYADETRPRFQGARLTAWELVRAEIPAALIPDSAAATLIRDGKIDLVILGADRITANGDVANKLGTFALSVICKHYGVPFYSAAPTTTIDFSTPSGDLIPIEERDRSEVTMVNGTKVAPDEIGVYNPSFDVTPHQNITGIITECGIIREPYDMNLEILRRKLGRQNA